MPELDGENNPERGQEDKDTVTCTATEQLASLRRVCSIGGNTKRATAAGALGENKVCHLGARVVKKILSGFFKGISVQL